MYCNYDMYILYICIYVYIYIYNTHICIYVNDNVAYK